MKQNIAYRSGFHTVAGTVSYARMAGFIATLGKQGRNLPEASISVFRGCFQQAHCNHFKPGIDKHPNQLILVLELVCCFFT